MYGMEYIQFFFRKKINRIMCSILRKHTPVFCLGYTQDSIRGRVQSIFSIQSKERQVNCYQRRLCYMVHNSILGTLQSTKSIQSKERQVNCYKRRHCYMVHDSILGTFQSTNGIQSEERQVNCYHRRLCYMVTGSKYLFCSKHVAVLAHKKKINKGLTYYFMLNL